MEGVTEKSPQNLFANTAPLGIIIRCAYKHSHYAYKYVGSETMSDELLRSVEAPPNEAVPDLNPGDVVNVYLRIKEGTRERVQEFRGTVIRSRNTGNNANFTVRRTASNGIGVERTFLKRSPRIEKVEVERISHVRRANLYYLRDRVGKATRLKQKIKK
jgi:large subunit ribosomal protein L19